MFTKQHYEAIAKVFAASSLPLDCLNAITLELADMFADDNDNFHYATFLAKALPDIYSIVNQRSTKPC